MYFRDVKGSEKLCLYKEGKNNREEHYNIKNKIVDNQIVALIGGTGSGKSVFMNELANELNDDCGYTVVYVTEKTGDEYANAFCNFPPKMQYHLDLLKQQNQEIKTKPVKLYHHFTFNIPYRRKMPPINWIISSVKDLNDVKLSAIMPTESEMALEVCQDIAQNLGKDNNMYDYLWEVFLKTREDVKHEDKIDVPEELYTPPEAVAGKVAFKNIKQGLKAFRTDWFLHEDSSPYKLDYVSMLNDNKHWHFLSTKWLVTKKSKLLAIIDFLINIDNAIKSGKVHRRIVLCFEELKILIPGGELTSQEGVLMKILYRLFSRIRTKAFVIGTMQSIFDINFKFRGLFNKVFLMKLNFNDLRILIKDFGFRVDDQNKLTGLRVGETVLWESQEEDEKITDKIVLDVPPFANAEQNEDFFLKYKQHHPEQMVDNQQFYQRMLRYKKRIEELSANRLKKWYQDQKRQKEKKELKKDDKKEELKELLREEKAEKKEIIMRKVYDMKQNNPDMSWRAIAKAIPEINTFNTAQKYYELMEQKLSLIKNAPDLG